MLEHLLAGALLASLVFYALTAGADFGGGVWDLLARGPRTAEQRALIAKAIAPIWEANHVWLILAVVILFTAFPPAFAVLATALHAPLTLALLGIVLRGAAFVFRTYDPGGERVKERWRRTFAISSLVTPVLLGISVGTVVSGNIRLEGGAVCDESLRAWIALFPLSVGAFALALFAYLAAAYLAVEATEPELRRDFTAAMRRSWFFVFGTGLLAFLLSFRGAPRLVETLRDRPSTWLVPALAVGAAVFAYRAAGRGRVHVARVLAALQILLVVLGWGLAQYPHLVVPDVAMQDAAAPPSVLRLLAIAIGLGTVLLFPTLGYLFYVFKGRRAFQILDPPESSGSAGPG